MRIIVTTPKLYEWLGRIIFWCGLVFFVMYQAYSLGVTNGKSNGYIRGYVDGRLNLRPVDPNLSPEEREEKQKQVEPPMVRPKEKGESKNNAVNV